MEEVEQVFSIPQKVIDIDLPRLHITGHRRAVVLPERLKARRPNGIQDHPAMLALYGQAVFKV
jgi:hypothetical protein